MEGYVGGFKFYMYMYDLYLINFTLQAAMLFNLMELESVMSILLLLISQ